MTRFGFISQYIGVVAKEIDAKHIRERANTLVPFIFDVLYEIMRVIIHKSDLWRSSIQYLHTLYLCY